MTKFDPNDPRLKRIHEWVLKNTSSSILICLSCRMEKSSDQILDGSCPKSWLYAAKGINAKEEKAD